MVIDNHWAKVVVVSAALTTACSSLDDSKRAGELRISASGEDLGANGYSFPPTAGQEVAFVDGWDLKFSRIIVAIDNIRLSEMPDKNPSDQSDFGTDIALRRGPFILDLRAPGNVQDKGLAGMIAIRLPIDDLKDLFDLQQRYAFSYDMVAASSESVYVNVTADDPDVQAMIQHGQRALLVGQANFRGGNCRSSGASYDFARLPKTVDFRFGLEGSVSYLNCQNPDENGAAIEGEESPRGIQLLPNAVTTAQITIHTDHFFWPAVAHENLPLFDQYAANAILTEGSYSVDLEMLQSVPVPGVTDRSGQSIPWRSCVDSSLYVLPTQPATMTFDAGSQPISNLRDFVRLNAATMGHLNADGLCYVK